MASDFFSLNLFTGLYEQPYHRTINQSFPGDLILYVYTLRPCLVVLIGCVCSELPILSNCKRSCVVEADAVHAASQVQSAAISATVWWKTVFAATPRLPLASDAQSASRLYTQLGLKHRPLSGSFQITVIGCFHIRLLEN